MKKTSKTGKKTTAEAGARLRELPSVDGLMARPTVAALAAEHGRAIVLRSARQALAGLRREIADGAELGVGDIEARVRGTVAAALEPSLRRVINATGVVLHTNLGRAPLSNEAASAIGATSTRYTNLEYDVAAGKRGGRAE